ncbi:MAG: hypothetical protein QM703_00360 [Gemmatales bacterium]
MLHRAWLLLVIILLSPLPVLNAQPTGKTKELLNKAIQAHGGTEALEKLSTATWKGRGLLYRDGKEDKPLPFYGDWSAELPGNYRYTHAFKGIGGRLPVTTGLMGDKAWRTMRPDRGADDLTEQQVKNEKDEAHAWHVSHLVPLLSNEYQLMPLPATQRDGRNIVGLKVDRKGYRSIYLFFDKQTNLLIYMDRKVFDPDKKQEVMQETSYLNFIQMGGATLPQSIARRQSKKLVMELDIDTVTPVASLPSKLFEKPPDPKDE